MCVCLISRMQAVKELGEWNGQCPPTAKHQRGKIITPTLRDVMGRVSLGAVCVWVCCWVCVCVGGCVALHCLSVCVCSVLTI